MPPEIHDSVTVVRNRKGSFGDKFSLTAIFFPQTTQLEQPAYSTPDKTCRVSERMF
jgi:hypothetical protein